MLFTLCIHTRAGCLGDTQNGRTYVTKCWSNDDNGENGGGDGDESLCWMACNEQRGTWKADGRWVRGDETLLQYIQRLLRPKCIKGYKTQKDTANMHHQWKLTVNRTEWQWHSHGTAHRPATSLTVSPQPHCLLERSSISHFSLQHTETRTVDSDVTVTVQTPMRTDKKQGIQHAQQVVHTGENLQKRVDSTTSIFLSHSARREIILFSL